jgi:protein gp37
MPERIDRPMPENVWLGVSVTKREELSRLDYLYDAPAGNHRFVSFEPLLDDVLDGPNGILIGLKWIIVGRLTGYGNKYNPSKVAIRRIINAAKMFEIPLFMKDNLKSIWPGKLIQEWPKW